MAERKIEPGQLYFSTDRYWLLLSEDIWEKEDGGDDEYWWRAVRFSKGLTGGSNVINFGKSEQIKTKKYVGCLEDFVNNGKH